MAKNLVVLMDGTNNQFGDNNTNIIKLMSVLPQEPGRQVVFYTAGVGTFGLRDVLFNWQQILPRVLGLAFGWGVRQTLESAYRFLMTHYEPGDQVYVFGFSRGAYTARALCAMLKGIGLLYENMPNQFDYAFDIMKQVENRRKDEDKREAFRAMDRFKALFSRPCEVRFLGLFDTVKSVGWIYSPFVFPYTAKNDLVHTVRHAVSLDERRCFFRQNLWWGSQGQDFQELWFAGVHSDVGGGYPEKESGLAKIPLVWICDAARQAGLVFNEEAYRQVVLGEGGDKYAPPNPLAQLHQSLTGAWWLVEPLPRLNKYKDAEGQYSTRIELPFLDWRQLGRYRRVDGTIRVHPSVKQRVDGNIGYTIPSVAPHIEVGE